MPAQSSEIGSPHARISFTDLVALLARLFERHGTSPQVAGVLGAHCASG